MRAGRRTDMNREFEVVIWPPLRLARMRCERGSVIAAAPTTTTFQANARKSEPALKLRKRLMRTSPKGGAPGSGPNLWKSRPDPKEGLFDNIRVGRLKSSVTP